MPPCVRGDRGLFPECAARDAIAHLLPRIPDVNVLRDARAGRAPLRERIPAFSLRRDARGACVRVFAEAEV